MEKETDVKVAVITGHHPFDVIAFTTLFRSLPGIDAYIQSLDDWAQSGASRAQYDVALFYNFHQETPNDEAAPWWEKGTRSALESLGSTPQGIVLLHHALLAYMQWPFWAELVGIPARDFSYYIDEKIRTEIAQPAHPITQGLEPWTMTDEAYLMQSPGTGSEALLTTDHPRSMHVLAWTRTFGAARVFDYAAGHDQQSWEHPSFRTVLARGIRWAAGRL